MRFRSEVRWIGKPQRQRLRPRFRGLASWSEYGGRRDATSRDVKRSLWFWASIVCLRFLAERWSANGRGFSQGRANASRRATLTGSLPVCMLFRKTKAMSRGNERQRGYSNGFQTNSQTGTGYWVGLSVGIGDDRSNRTQYGSCTPSFVVPAPTSAFPWR